ncbi:MAG: lectin-like protein [Phycisphaerae bacterium]|jgi:hypothetical protein|nr:lectin-like protein [Phycisphaerae bacterium]
MRTAKHTFAAYAILIALLINAAPAAEVRVWRPDKGARVEAKLVTVKGGRVYLKRTDGRAIDIGLNRLSKADRDYLANLKKPASAAKPLKANTTFDPKAWYATRRFALRSALVAECLIQAGQSYDFEVRAKGKKTLYIGFTVKEAQAIKKSYGEKEGGAIKLVSHAQRNDPMSFNLGVGMEWTVKSEKLRFTIGNRSKVDTLVAIYTKKEQKQGVEFIQIGVAGRGAVAWNGHFYKLFPGRVPWTKARSKCKAMGGHLVTIGSAKENEHVVKMAADLPKNNKGVWIGCTDEKREGQWTWITGEQFSYKNWTPGRPGNRNRDNDYGALVRRKWNDSRDRGQDSKGRAYICEWDSAPKKSKPEKRPKKPKQPSPKNRK